MPGPSATLFNHQTNTYEEVPAEQVSTAIASGQYTVTGTSTETQAEGGLTTRPIEQLGAAATQGETEAGGVNAARAAGARREAQKLAVSDSGMTWAEGVVDALTVGLVHGTREEDELRRESDSGSALLGQLTGTALGLALPIGPVKWLTEGGEALGGGVARTLLGEAEGGFKGLVAAGLKESAANATLMAATAFGHQVTDAVIADKPFAGEAIANEAGMGALLGFGFGFAGSAFGQLAKASRGAVEASGVAVKESGTALDAVQNLTRQWDNAVEQHAQRLGVLKVLADEGHIPGNILPERAAVLRQAEKARDALRAVDSDIALAGDAKEYAKWRDAVENYQEVVGILDRKMAPSLRERFGAPKILGESPNSAGPQIHPTDVDQWMVDRGMRTKMAEGLDKAMTLEDRVNYQRIYGHPYEDLPRPAAGWEKAEENLGGKVTPTSGLETNPGARGRRVTPESLPREVVEAGERPVPQAETGQDFVESTKRKVTQPTSEGKQAVRSYMNDWVREFDARPRVRVADQLQASLQEALDKLKGSRLDSAGSLEVTKSLGLKEATSPLGQRLDQVWSLNKIARMAADESRGVKTPLRNGLINTLKRYTAGKAGRAVGGAVIGGSMGGPVGAILGMAAASAGFSGKAAATAGKLMTEVAKVGEALLKGRRATIATRAVLGNRPYQYDDQGPIKDPVQRIITLQRLAGNPDLIRARVMKQVGDVSLTSPEMSQHMVNTITNQLQVVAKSAPAIMFTPLGKPVPPTGTALQKFYDMENAIHDLPGILDAVAKGTASSTQIRALQLGFPAVHAELAKNILPMREALERLEAAKLRTIEKVLGMPLTRATANPAITARFQGNWTVDPGTPKPAQAFKITANKPTAAQSMSVGDRAPGNERKTP